MNKEKFLLKIIIYVTLICTYMIPITLLEPFFLNFSKLIFIIVMSFIYFLKLSKSNIKEFILLLFILFLTITTKNINYMLFISLLLLPKIINEDNKKYLKKVLCKGDILYICLLFTIIYSIMYFGVDGRFVHTGLISPNQSGLAIFCLAILLLKKNKIIGKATMILGCLTLSRSYFLAVLIYLFSKTKIYKNFKENKIKWLTYNKLCILSTIMLVLLGIIYINQYRMGNIVSDSASSSRLFHLLDYSNFYRFTAVLILLNILKNNPASCLLGISEDYYIESGIAASKSIGIPYHYTVPHNLLLAHLKLYGIFSIVEVIYTSNILKKLININNFYLFIIIFLYSAVLGAGLYSYWLYLSIIIFIMYEKNDKEF